MKTVQCGTCGHLVHPGAITCPGCGATGKSKVAAGLLALFLGAFGIHRFYLGQIWGLRYMLFTGIILVLLIIGVSRGVEGDGSGPLIMAIVLLGILETVSLIEAVVFFCTNVVAWNQKYGFPRTGQAMPRQRITREKIEQYASWSLAVFIAAWTAVMALAGFDIATGYSSSVIHWGGWVVMVIGLISSGLLLLWRRSQILGALLAIGTFGFFCIVNVHMMDGDVMWDRLFFLFLIYSSFPATLIWLRRGDVY